MSSNCQFCGHAHLTPTTTRYIHQQGDELLIVEEVPCLRCDYCGEEYCDISTLKKIEADHLALATHRKRPARKIEVAVEPFSAL
jgi:YgiT-type zinc finger domain-containing protein